MLKHISCQRATLFCHFWCESLTLKPDVCRWAPARQGLLRRLSAVFVYAALAMQGFPTALVELLCF